MSRLLLYGVGSTVALVSAVLSASYRHHWEFFPTAIHLTHNNAYLMVLMNMVLWLAVAAGQLAQFLFFGQLRMIEQEHLYERLWFSISESCLAMTVFRDEFNSRFVLHFTWLLLVKTFHWISLDRVDFMEQTPRLSQTFHIRMTTLLCLLFLVDLAMVHIAVHSLLHQGASMMIMFGFEYAILLVIAVSTFIKYALHSIEQHRATPWDDKSLYVFYLDLVADFLKLASYICFFAIILHHYGLPIHIIRDLYGSFQAFVNRFRSFLRYRRAMANMNDRYPDATDAELDQTDRTCIICREDMDVRSQPKRLPCGHIFHFRCLRSWLERQQTCPTCRRNVLTAAEPQEPAAPVPPPVVPVAAGPALPHPDQAYRAPTGPRPSVSASAASSSSAQIGGSASTSTASSLSAGPSDATATTRSLGEASIQQDRASAASASSSRTVTQIPGFQLVPLFASLPGQSIAMQGLPQAASFEGQFQSLSDAELREMEGQERRHVLARLRFLAGVQEDLGLLVTRLTQFSSILEQQPGMDHGNPAVGLAPLQQQQSQ